MPTKTVDNFINDLSAKMAGLSRGDYIDLHEQGLTKLERLRTLADKVKVENIKSFKKARELKSILSSLYCYAFNNDKGSWEKVGKIENIIGLKMLKFARRYNRIKDKRVRAVAKHLITCRRYYYRSEDVAKMAKILLQTGKLFKNKDGRSYLVIGLHYSTGDNTFSYDRNGKMYRNYVPVCVPQAFWVRGRYEETIRKLEEQDGLDIPVLDEEIYQKTDVGDGKHLAKVYPTWEEDNIIRAEFIK